jgi:hypothetical protein
MDMLQQHKEKRKKKERHNTKGDYSHIESLYAQKELCFPYLKQTSSQSCYAYPPLEHL